MSNFADLTALVEDLETAGKRVEPLREQVLDDVAQQLLFTQQELVPVKTGKLKSGLKIQRRNGWRQIGADHDLTPYDVFQEYGTKGPYEISAKPGKVLAFKMGGKTVYTKKVVHPGIRANPYIRPSLARWMDTLGERMALVGAQVITQGESRG